MALVWVLVGLALVAVELHHLAFYAVFAAAGAFVAAAVAALTPAGLPVQVVVAVGVMLAGIAGARPFVSQAYDRRRGHAGVARGVHGGLTGHEVVALDIVGDAHDVGHVQLFGERWLAVAAHGKPIPAGTRAIVTAVTGTTLLVMPLDELEAPPIPPESLPPSVGIPPQSDLPMSTDPPDAENGEAP